MPETDFPKSTRISIMWKNGSKVDVHTITIFRTGNLLNDIRRELEKHPVMGMVYWRDDIFDPEVFHAHHRIRSPFEKLGDSIGTAYVIRENKS